MSRDLLLAALAAALIHVAALTVLPGRSGPAQRPGALGRSLRITLTVAPDSEPPSPDGADLDRAVRELADTGPAARHPAPSAELADAGTTMKVAAAPIRPVPLDVTPRPADLPAARTPEPAGPAPALPGPLLPGAVMPAIAMPTSTIAGAGDGDASPTIVENPAPRFPPAARRRGQEGEVLLEVEVLAAGRAGAIRVLRSSGHAALDREALRAVRGWRFEPARLAGRAVSRAIHVPIEFRLEE